MKKIIFVIFLLSYSYNCFGDGGRKPIQIGIFNSKAPGNLDIVKSVFKNLYDTLKGKYPLDFNAETFSGIDVFHIHNRSAASKEVPKERLIATFSPIRFLEYQKMINPDVIPILMTYKGDNPRLPYYSSYFITNPKSLIKSVNDPHIKRIYFVDSSSASGYIIPLYELWMNRIISAPNLRAVRKKGWDIRFTASHPYAYDAVDTDLNAIAACGKINDQRVRILLAFGSIPQDVVVISKDLKKYRNDIEDWFLNNIDDAHFIRTANGRSESYASIFSANASKIKGFIAYDSIEHLNAFNNLNHIYEFVMKCKNMDAISPLDAQYLQEKSSEKKKERFNNKMTFLLLSIFSIVCFIMVFFWSFMATKAGNKIKKDLNEEEHWKYAKVKRKYALYAWGFFSAFILLGAELIRTGIDELLHSTFTGISSYTQFLIVAVGIILAYLSEQKIKFAVFITKLLNPVIKVLQAFVHIFAHPHEH